MESKEMHAARKLDSEKPIQSRNAKRSYERNFDKKETFSKRLARQIREKNLSNQNQQQCNQ